MATNHLHGGELPVEANSAMPTSESLPLPPQLNTEIPIELKRQLDSLIERLVRLRQLEGDPDSLTDEHKKALMDELIAIVCAVNTLTTELASGEYGNRAVRRDNALLILEWFRRELMRLIQTSRLPLECHATHLKALYDATARHIWHGGLGAEAIASRVAIHGDHPLDNNAHISAHSCGLSNEAFYIPIDNTIDGGRAGYGREATENANGLNRPAGGGYMGNFIGPLNPKLVLILMGLLFASAGACWEAYPVIEQALGPKWAPFAYGAVCVPVSMLGAGAFAALVFDKSPKSKVFIKYALLLSIIITVALPLFVLGSMIFG